MFTESGARKDSLVRQSIDHAVAVGLGTVAAYGVALLSKVVMFRACHSQPCSPSVGRFVQGLPGGLALMVAAWFIARVATRSTAAPTGVLAAIVLYALQAPLSSGWPLSMEIRTIPGDFFVSGIIRMVVGIVPMFLGLPKLAVYTLAPVDLERRLDSRAVVA